MIRGDKKGETEEEIKEKKWRERKIAKDVMQEEK